MKNFYCYIIDDEKEDIKIIEAFIAKIPGLILAGSSTDPEQGLRTILKSNRINILFLDVQMEPISGLEILPQLDKHIQVVLCTSHRKFACQAYEEWPLDYLLKPFSFTRFTQVVRFAEAKLHYSPSIRAHEMDYSYFFVPTGVTGWREKVDFVELLYVTADGETVTFYMVDGTQLTVGKRLSEVYKQLPKNQFLRIHRSHVINIKAVKRIKYGKIVLNNNAKTELAIGTTYAKEVYAWWDDYRLR